MKLLPQHGVLISMGGMGVFLIGESGVGKSETALQLMHQGASLICDDAPEFTTNKENTKITGACTEDFYGLMHIRDIGIIDIRNILGQQYFKKEHKVDYIIELIQDNMQKLAAVNLSTNEAICYYQHQRSLICIPGIKIHISPHRNIPLIVQIAMTQLALSKR